MRKIAMILFAVAALVMCEGCRRNVKREPVLVNKEADYIYTRNTNYMLKKFVPPPKAPEVAEGIDPKIQQAIQEAEQKAREAAEKQKKLDNFDAAAKEYGNFIKKVKPIDYSVDKFKTFVRRAGLHELRHDELDPGSIKPLFMCLQNKPGHLLMHRSAADNGAYAALEVAVANPGMPGGLTSISEGALNARIKTQELEAMLYYVWDFSKSYYVNKPADPRLANRMTGYLGNFVPWYGLNGIRTDVEGLGQYLKKTPETRNLGKFRRYLNENAPPDFLKALDDNHMRVSVSADLANPAHLVACLIDTGGKGGGSSAIASNGNIRQYDNATIEQWFPQQKKD